MRTGYNGTFVISWSQTEADGVTAPPIQMIQVGAAWRWSGQPVRVDAPGSVLLLEGAQGVADLRLRAARMVRRLVGAAITPRNIEVFELDDGPEQGFVVTDGRSSFAASVIPVPESAARLVMFVGANPPPGVDLWIVSVSMDRAKSEWAAPEPGGVICFVPGTLIATPDGPRAIEHLQAGDRIDTADNGPQHVIWTGNRRMTGARLFAMPHLRPVRIRADALGLGRPDQDLIVSPQHRMLVRGAAALALFNTSEVLVRAQDLINDHTVMVDSALREVTYIHILLDAHQIVFANGLETESFHPSNAALDTIEPAQRAELMSILPGIDRDPYIYGGFARRNLSGSEAAILRHEAA
ncbi:MAG: Hint domain-containing protein [Gemmobacter sp.]|nr:Hint domain-containing protein [Gemmobacter sp.]